MKKKLLFVLLLLFVFSGVSAQHFAVIGDYGVDDSKEKDVADLVKSWKPEFIVTVGDNNYSKGEASTIDANIGKYYSDYIYPYKGKYGTGARSNKFFPVAGNHDYDNEDEDAAPYYDYFRLPGNERYYDFVKGDVHFFGINSNKEEPDGITSTSKQARWLQSKLASSNAKWKIVYLHHAPYSSGKHGNTSRVQWPFASWGATAVIAGHDHHYERMESEGISYFVNGTGGRTLYELKEDDRIPETEVIHGDYGAMLIDASSREITFQFWTRDKVLVDSYTMKSNEVTINKSIVSETDDAEENLSTGRVSRSSGDIELGVDASAQIAGLRYQNLDIPKGANILNAYIEFTVEDTDSGTCNVEFSGHATGNSGRFSSSSRNISNRPKTNAKVSWSPRSWSTINAKKNSPDLKRIIQEIVNRSSWSSGNSLSILMEGKNGTRQAESFDGNTGLAPKLIISYDDNEPTDSDGRVIAQITSGNDDVEENETTGILYMNSSDLELGFDSHRDQNFQTLGLRFNGLSIPVGADITNAYLEFTTKAANTDTSTLVISGHDRGDSPAFSSSAAFNVSTRSKTSASVRWSPGVWTTIGATHKSPDLSQIVQEIINRSAWNSGNSMTMMVKGSAGTRRAYSYEGSSRSAVKLVISYRTNARKAGEPDEVSDSVTSSDETDVSTITVFPNPLKRGAPLNIKMENIDDGNSVDIKIYDIKGVLVQESQTTSNRKLISLSTSKLSSGVYILLMQKGSSKETFKFVISE